MNDKEKFLLSGLPDLTVEQDHTARDLFVRKKYEKPQPIKEQITLLGPSFEKSVIDILKLRWILLNQKVSKTFAQKLSASL